MILKSIFTRYKKFIAKPAVCRYHIVSTYESYARVHLNACVEEKDKVLQNDKENRGAGYEPSEHSIVYEFISESMAAG